MTPRLTASLHALTQAARKGMPMPELEMHLEQITSEMQRLQERAQVHDGLMALTLPVPGGTVKDESGHKAVSAVELRGPIGPFIEMIAMSCSRDSAWAMKIYATSFFSGNKDIAQIIAEYGKAAAAAADQLTALADSKKQKQAEPK